MLRREKTDILTSRLTEKRQFIQVIAGPRQVGKTTMVQMALGTLPTPHHYASADNVMVAGQAWIVQQWEMGRQLLQTAPEAVLALDEIQKVANWSEVVKQLWDADSLAGRNLKVVLLGSAQLLLQRGLTESLAGRFELIQVTHWSYAEMRAEFGFSLEQYLWFGGYPGAAGMVGDEERWRHYIRDTLIETTIAKDVLMLAPVQKPALLRNLFFLGCHYSGQQLSFQKMTGQLQDVGNASTLSHYLSLLDSAGLLCGIMKYAGQAVRRQASSPKLLALNNALMNAAGTLAFAEARQQPDRWGRIVETAIGNHLRNASIGTRLELFYWQDRQLELDFVLRSGTRLTAIEVKSGRSPTAFPAIEAFAKHFPVTRKLLVGGTGIPIREFLATPPGNWL